MQNTVVLCTIFNARACQDQRQSNVKAQQNKKPVAAVNIGTGTFVIIVAVKQKGNMKNK